MRNNYGLTILTLEFKGKQSNRTGNMKKVNFVPKDVERILSSHKILEKYNEQKVFHKKAVLKNFSIFTGKYLCWNFFSNKTQALRSAALLKSDSNTRVFL